MSKQRKAELAAAADKKVDKNDLSVSVIDAARAVVEAWERAAEAVGVQDEGSTRARVSAALLAEAPITGPALARALGFSRQHARSVLMQMQKAGLVETVSNPAHKASPRWRLTSAGVYAERDRQAKRRAVWADRPVGVKRKHLERAAAALEELERALGADDGAV